jgi:hypothetical protein
MQFRAIETDARFGKRPEVVELHLVRDRLTLKCEPENGGAAFGVAFDGVRGFRCLDEGDLLDFWDHLTIRDGWFFEILEGGWRDLEAHRPGFLSKILEFREYLIISDNLCVSILTKIEPRMVEPYAV